MIVKPYDNTERSLSFRLGLNVSGADVSIFDSSTDKYQGLDMDFEIDKTIESEPNKSTVTIWNIGADLYNRLEKGKMIELYGAFGQEDYKLMFTGNLDVSTQEKSSIVSSSNEGFLKQDEAKGGQVDIPTTLIMYDAGVTYKTAKLQKSYKGAISAEVIINDCLNVMNIPQGKVENIVYPSLTDYVARGNCVSILNYITGRMGAYYNVTNGLFNLSMKSKPDETQGIVLTDKNSNRPERNTVDLGDEKFLGWKIETGLLPFLIPDTYCELDFPQIKGVKRIVRVVHRGNNYGTKGITEVYVV